MYNQLKKRLLENLNIIKQFQIRLLQVKTDEEKFDILNECQQAAIVIGETIEKSGDTDNGTVHFLEEYCEMLFLLSEKSQVSSHDISELSQQLDKVFVGIRKLPTKYRVVFLPYKADMWDSLESIWIACSKDENCDCKVVPLPYYELNRIEQKWEYRYDGERFPKDLPVVHYSNYQLDILQPDIAYIHNPYDDHNHVTMVYPAYHSKELKKYVGKLVYVPYYVNTGFISEAFQKLPSFYCMDYIIVQSEMAKESCKDAHFYNKVLPLGSPKLDKVINFAKYGVCMPEEWKEILQKKKVLMLNTTINDILNNEEKVIDKLKYFFGRIENQEYVALIWRPHPLIEATLKSLRPELVDKYRELVVYYKEKKIGVYDTTGDVSNTVVVSDAYVGSSYSSVINLFGVCGKPIFLFNNEIYDNDRASSCVNGFAKKNALDYFCCRESQEFTIQGFIDDLANDRLKKVKERQLIELADLAANQDGTCGEKVHKYMMDVLRKEE